MRIWWLAGLGGENRCRATQPEYRCQLANGEVPLRCSSRSKAGGAAIARRAMAGAAAGADTMAKPIDLNGPPRGLNDSFIGTGMSWLGDLNGEIIVAMSKISPARPVPKGARGARPRKFRLLWAKNLGHHRLNVQLLELPRGHRRRALRHEVLALLGFGERNHVANARGAA